MFVHTETSSSQGPIFFNSPAAEFNQQWGNSASLRPHIITLTAQMSLSNLKINRGFGQNSAPATPQTPKTFQLADRSIINKRKSHPQKFSPLVSYKLFRKYTYCTSIVFLYIAYTVYSIALQDQQRMHFFSQPRWTSVWENQGLDSKCYVYHRLFNIMAVAV